MTTTTTTIAPRINEWTGRNGQVRRYVNNWRQIIGMEVQYYKTGSISDATIDGYHISNAAANRLRCVKVWIDQADEIHVDYWQDGTERYHTSPDEIKAAVQAAIDAHPTH